MNREKILQTITSLIEKGVLRDQRIHFSFSGGDRIASNFRIVDGRARCDNTYVNIGDTTDTFMDHLISDWLRAFYNKLQQCLCVDNNLF